MEMKKFEVKDAHEMDKKIPRDLIIMYQGKPYITKAGLEYKLASLFGAGTFGIETEIVEKSSDYVLAKATLRLQNGVTFNNFGEASKLNVSNPMMHKHLLHLAVTRAENRVIRMATACGYVSIEEMDQGGEEKEIPVGEKDGELATPAQISAIQSLKGEIKEEMTQADAKKIISDLTKK